MTDLIRKRKKKLFLYQILQNSMISEQVFLEFNLFNNKNENNSYISWFE